MTEKSDPYDPSKIVIEYNCISCDEPDTCYVHKVAIVDGEVKLTCEYCYMVNTVIVTGF